MKPKTKNILLTGPPRCGKSTLIEKLISKIEKPMTGFFTYLFFNPPLPFSLRAW
jgi:predicted AAA+ superfamily ATPase